MYKRILQSAVAIAAVLLLMLPLPAAEFYVASDGNDANSGTRDAPLKTLAAARDAGPRTLAGNETVTVHVADGIYYLPETLVFRPDDSGSEEHRVGILGAEIEDLADLDPTRDAAARFGDLARKRPRHGSRRCGRSGMVNSSSTDWHCSTES